MQLALCCGFLVISVLFVWYVSFRFVFAVVDWFEKRCEGVRGSCPCVLPSPFRGPSGSAGSAWKVSLRRAASVRERRRGEPETLNVQTQELAIPLQADLEPDSRNAEISVLSES